LRGATALGMEPTYYWDGLDQSVLDWLLENTQENEKIYFAAGSEKNLELMRRWQVLPRETNVAAPGEFRWYVLQRRPSALKEVDLWLIEHCQPAFEKTIHPGGVGPWRLDVPLIQVFSFQQYLQAGEAIRTEKE
jgi:hypothetical protein